MIEMSTLGDVGDASPHTLWRGFDVLLPDVVRLNGRKSLSEIIVCCHDGLRGYKKPRQVVFLAELPKPVSGKIVKRALRGQLSNEVSS